MRVLHRRESTAGGILSKICVFNRLRFCIVPHHTVPPVTCSELRISAALLENIDQCPLILIENISIALLTFSENRLGARTIRLIFPLAPLFFTPG
jgi:hypothetical protein